ncbi:disintegrin and metalloproteinase domain-containing protein 2-like [Gracilinanus agilis]|uniref:disintegrin and metalloproteinase domain-containing protein 2-like n=1 Tax=Gracilinanus agilis TaxID=191870 RepID=UPI001CFDF441|nr:disintegrin and metalloproteinase domain-containing protein 2-like [Gracilinanus agilis]
MFLLPLLLSGLLKVMFSDLAQAQLSSKDSQQIFLSMTTPIKISPSTGILEPTYVSYSITIEEKPHILLLHQKIFLPHDFRIYIYNEEGILTSLDPFFKNVCFYQGHVADFPNSLVTLSTCSGIRGWLQFENFTYGIEPLASSLSFEHVIYRVKNNNPNVVFLYTEKDTNVISRRSAYELPQFEYQLDFFSSFSGYLEMHVVVEKNLYEFLGSDANIVTQKIVMVVGLISTMFSSLNLTVVLSSLEFWVDDNKIDTVGEPDEILKRFLIWKESYLVLRRHDVAYLLVYRDVFKYVGATFQGKMCERNSAAGIAMYPRIFTLEALSVVIAQLLAHSMGITYDDERCQCPSAVCIMTPQAVKSTGVKAFSSCSVAAFKDFVLRKNPECLQNRPQLDPSYRSAVCGNGVLEADEECDCGFLKACTVCCRAWNCKLIAGKACAHGECCENCQFRAKGTKCRNPIDLECDLPEYCNGSSGFCQTDLYVQNGRECRSQTSYCIKGKCLNPDEQCKDVFGPGSTFAPYECFEELNSKADRTGNCGYDDRGYHMCPWKDLRCGKLLCEYRNSTPFFNTTAVVIYVNVRNHTCITLDHQVRDVKKDPMWVTDGVICGYKAICYNHKCVPVSTLGYDCTGRKCNFHGICNNRRNCHCDDGWRPPDCSTPIAGIGASIDSGIHSKSDIFVIPSGSTSSKKWNVIACFFIVLILAAGGIVTAKFLWHGQKWKCRVQEASSDESFSEDSHIEETNDYSQT